MEFDLVMPVTLFVVTIVAMFLDKRVEGKLKGVLEEREFRIRDALLLVASLVVTVSVIVFIPDLAIMAVFLFSYSMLLFMFGYLFSNMSKGRTMKVLMVFIVIAIVAGAASLFSFVNLGWRNEVMYGGLAFFGMAGFASVALIFERSRSEPKERWYLAVLPPAVFISFYLFFNRTPLWFPYLLDSYGAIFAVLIILYLGSLFAWKTTLVFVGLLTVMDTILVLVTKTMVSAATTISALKLPVLISLPTIPAILDEGTHIWMSLGLGDFFFAGLLTIQTNKRYGIRAALLSAVAMTISFLLFESYILTFKVHAFPGTVMIISGWIPMAIASEVAKRSSGKA